MEVRGWSMVHGPRCTSLAMPSSNGNLTSWTSSLTLSFVSSLNVLLVYYALAIYFH